MNSGEPNQRKKDPPRPWVELILHAGELADEVGALIADDEVARAGVEIRGDEVVIWAPAEEAEAGAEALRRAAARLRDAGLPIDPATVRVAPAKPEAEWRDAWKRWFKVARVGERIVIVPSWERYAACPGEVVLDLDPGRAFGTGAHASTRLCLLELDRLAAEGGRPSRFLDVGTGSGILAIAAAKLWPEAAGIAVDVDADALDAARENLLANAVAERVELRVGDVGAAVGPFELVLANIQADVLEGLRRALTEALAPGGRLVLSGILTPQAESLAKAFEAGGLRRLHTGMVDDDRDWIAIVFDRPGTPTP